MGDLFILSIGVEPTLTAKGVRDWYAQDAEYVRRALVRAEPLYDTVHSRVLNGAKATRTQVLRGLNWLADSAHPSDVVILFVSGHGSVEADKGYRIDLARAGTDPQGTGFLWGSELAEALRRVRGKAIVWIDTCHAGALVSNAPAALPQAAYLAACGPHESSSGQWERPDRPHGYFVIAACEALAGLADEDHDGVVTLGDVLIYLPARAKAFYPRQNAVGLWPEDYLSIPLARADTGYTVQQLWTPPRPRNPFGEPDVPDPCGEDVRAFASQVTLPGGKDEPNAEPWNSKPLTGSAESLDGEWESRWNGDAPGSQWSVGMAEVRSVGDCIYILFQQVYLIELRRAGDDLLVGRYKNLTIASDSTPWVGRIISPERIDGRWAGGRWDLRRRLSRG